MECFYGERQVKQMKYIILVAGMGKRLSPITNNQPKCLYNLGQDCTIIQRMIGLIHRYDKSAEIITVVGFQHKSIEDIISNSKFIFNPFYEVTNSIASLWFAREHLCDDVTIINGDIVCEENLVQAIVTRLFDNSCALIDSSIKSNGDYNVQVYNDNILIMSKNLINYYGEYAGIIKLNLFDSAILFDEINLMINEGSYNEWYEDALVRLIFNDKIKLKFLDIKDYNWTEVDCVDDLIKAKLIYERSSK